MVETAHGTTVGPDAGEGAEAIASESEDGIVRYPRGTARIHGSVIDGRTGKPCEAVVWGGIPERVGPQGFAADAPEGRFQIDGLVAGTYTLIARSREGLVGVETDVAVTADTEEVALTLQEGGHVQVSWPGEGVCMLHFAGVHAGQLLEPGTLAVPPGDLTVEFWGTPEDDQKQTVRIVRGEIARVAFN
jgi:hypothetical protein